MLRIWRNQIRNDPKHLVGSGGEIKVKCNKFVKWVKTMLFETISVHILHIFLEFVQNFDFCNFSITNLLEFSANNLFQVHLFPIISTDLKSAENFAFFDTHMLKNA